jgi:hypothetical protein
MMSPMAAAFPRIGGTLNRRAGSADCVLDCTDTAFDVLGLGAWDV